MDALIFRHIHRVTYAECTVGNHVYYSRYLDMLETARGEFFRHLGTTFRDLQNQDAIFPVTECRISYKSPARYDESLAIELWLEEPGRVRFVLGGRIFGESGLLILEAATTHVCTTQTGKPRRLPEALSRSLAPYLRAAATRSE